MRYEAEQPAPRYARYMPQLRSAYIERFRGGPHALTMYTNEEYLDPGLVDPVQYRQVSRRQLLRVLATGTWDVVALPEPLWIVEMPYSLTAAVVAKGAGLLRRRRVRVVSYAIENSPVARLLGLPTRIPARLRSFALGLAVLPYSLLIDRIAFGTGGAAENYRFPLSPFRGLGARRAREFAPLAPACDCTAGEADPDLVLFLGPLEERKGLDTILEAWPLVLAERPSARLVVCGDGPLRSAVDELAESYPSVTRVTGASRGEMHRLLRAATVLVSLPRTTRRWREQIGLSLTEGISHGCHIVTTEETGFAGWLASQRQTVLSNPEAREAADGIASALGAPQPVEELPALSGRAQAEWWMMTGEATTLERSTQKSVEDQAGDRG
ncbi:MAG: glycosyltransferase [Microbacterium sp.]|nr:glycosyltransferase [Microbacterium sp.]